MRITRVTRIRNSAIFTYVAILLSSVIPVASAQVIVSAGYLNNLSGSPPATEVPTPFDPSPTTILISTGEVDTRHDTGVIWFDNRSGVPVSLDRGFRVTTEQGIFQVWDESLPIILAPGQGLVLAETRLHNFDSSDSGLNGAPIISGSLNGTSFSFTDTGRVLLGREEAVDTPETTPYQALGSINVTVAQAFTTAATRCDDRSLSSALGTFGQAFDQQLRSPILEGLEDAGADKSLIEHTKVLLDAKSKELERLLTEAISSTGARMVQLPTLFTEKPLPVPQQVNVKDFSPPSTTPEIRTTQTLSDIQANGFDPDRVSVEWENIAVHCTLTTSSDSAEIGYVTRSRVNLFVTPAPTGGAKEAFRFNNLSHLKSLSTGLDWGCSAKCTINDKGEKECTIECHIGGKF